MSKQRLRENHNSTCHVKRNSKCSISNKMLEVISAIHLCSIFSFGNIFHPNLMKDAGRSRLSKLNYVL